MPNKSAAARSSLVLQPVEVNPYLRHPEVVFKNSLKKFVRNIFANEIQSGRISEPGYPSIFKFSCTQFPHYLITL